MLELLLVGASGLCWIFLSYAFVASLWIPGAANAIPLFAVFALAVLAECCWLAWLIQAGPQHEALATKRSQTFVIISITGLLFPGIIFSRFMWAALFEPGSRTTMEVVSELWPIPVSVGVLLLIGFHQLLYLFSRKQHDR